MTADTTITEVIGQQQKSQILNGNNRINYNSKELSSPITSSTSPTSSTILTSPQFIATPTSINGTDPHYNQHHQHYEPSASVTRKRSAADFQFLECIGEGSYSKVYRAVSRKNVHTYAIKILNKQHIHKEKKRKYVTIEKNTLNVLGKHPGIVTLYYTFQDPKSLYFVIDFAQNGELLNLIHKLGSLSYELSKYYTVQLIDTILFIHGKGIIHRDLKPENILLGSDWKIMITDFGAAKFLDENDSANNNSRSNSRAASINTAMENEDSGDSNGSFVGTAEYISPELLRYNESSFASDYWSLGCIIYQMFVGIPPFKASNEYETFERIVELNYSFPDPNKYPIPSSVVDIIQKLLLEDPIERLGSDSIKLQPWFKDIDWTNENKIWGPVPPLEPYKPEKYFRFKKTVQQQQQQQAKQLQQLQTQTEILKQQIQQQQLKNAQVFSTPGVSSNGNKNNNNKQVLVPTKAKRVAVDYVNDKPRIVLKKQIHNAQNNTQLMNKVLTNRIEEKSSVITKKLASPTPSPVATNNNSTLNNSSVKVVHISPKSQKIPPPTAVTETDSTSKDKNASSSSLQINKKRLSAKSTAPVSPVQKKRLSSDSINSLFTTNDSSKSVIITRANNKSIATPTSTTAITPTMAPLTTFSSNNTVKINKKPLEKPIVVEKKQPVKISTVSLTNKPKSTFNTVNKPSASISSAKTNQLPFIPKNRVSSADATAAAGAIGTLLTHKRHLNSTSSTTTQYKQLQNHQKQLINPVLLDRQIPSIITSKLMQHETILKLDNIFKSEISHKPNQFTSPGENLNHTVLENIIHKYDRELEKDLKACVMVITSYARLFIYELNDDFRLNKPQSATKMQALDFYMKIIEIKLTNKNVSLYDYEFDEEMHDGYLILELSNVNKLVFLSAWDRSKLIKGGINSNVRVGFHVNENESWVKSFLKAKQLLKRREVAEHNNLAKNNNDNTNKAKQNTQPRDGRSGSTSSMHQSFRKLKLNTHSKIRSLSTSSSKEATDVKAEKTDKKIEKSPSSVNTSVQNIPKQAHKYRQLTTKKNISQLPMQVRTSTNEENGKGKATASNPAIIRKG